MAESQRIAALLEKLINQPKSSFPKARGRVEAPDRAGVYVIRNKVGKVMYVGRTTRAKGGLHQRLRNHLAGRSVFARALKPDGPASLRSGYTFQYLVVEKSRTRALLEQLATGTLCPKHLGLGLLAEESDA